MEKDILRIAIAGSVNEGKSSFVGRLLYETDSLYQDQLAEVQLLTKEAQFQGSSFDFSLFTDGLEYERQNNVTVDVAYRYMEMSGRKVIIADCPGHFEYNKNMVTACSRAQVLMVVLDAKLVLDRKKISEQTFRHLHIAETLGVPKIVIVITKTDLFPSTYEVTKRIKEIFSEQWGKKSQFHFLPCSAFSGDGFPEVLDFLAQVSNNVSIRHFDILELQTELANNVVLCRAYEGKYRVDQELWIYPSKVKIQIQRLFYNFSEVQTLEVPAGRTVEMAFEYRLLPVRTRDDAESIKSLATARDQVAVVNADLWTTKSRFTCQLMWFSEKKIDQLSGMFLKFSSMKFDLAKVKVIKKFSLTTLKYEFFSDFEFNQTLLCEIEVEGHIPFFKPSDSILSQKFILVDGINCETLAFGITHDETL